MTNKEAIEVIKGIYPGGAYSQTEEQRLEAINMAISALTTTPEEPASEDLEDAAEKYAQEAYSHPVDRNVGKADFILGAQWQNEQMAEALRTEYEKGRYDMRVEMMKDAIKARIIFGDNALMEEPVPTSIKDGDKVKLIVIKED